MKAAIISLGSKSSEWIAKEMKNFFEQVDYLNLADIEISLGGKTGEVLYQEKPIGDYDCVYVRGSFRFTSLLRSVTSLLWDKSYMPIHPDAFIVGRDKLLTHLKLQAAGIPQPKTYLVAKPKIGKQVLKEMTYPVVMKLLSGTHGKGVMLADSRESASSMMDALAALRQPFLIQEYIETEGTDIRVIVAGNEAIAWMRRIAETGEKRANIHAGGRGEKVKLDEKFQTTAVQAAKAVGCDLCAVDLLDSTKGPMVIEVNLSPGLQGITSVTEENVAEKVAKFLFDKTKAYKERKTEKEKTSIPKVLEEIKPEQEILTKLNFRGQKMLLPEFVTKLSGITEQDEIIIKASKGKFTVRRS